jgi:amino acid transporter
LTASASLSISASSNEAQTRSLRKELGFTDLVFASILMVVIPDFFGTAVKAGPAHLLLWLLAIALFFIPQALVVAHLKERLPIEGGLYEWARHGFGDAIGFLTAWNLWLYAVVYTASLGLVACTYAGYALGLDVERLSGNKWLLMGASVLAIGVLMLMAHVGLRIGKWLTNIGSALTVLVVVVLAALPYYAMRHGSLAEYHPLRLAMPPLTVFSVSVFSKMTFGALCGLEYVAIFSGEARDPRRHLKSAIFLAAPVIALLYIFGTSAILAFVSPDNIDLIGPVPQALHVALGNSRLAQMVVPVAILFLLTNYLSSFGLSFAANTRLPMCAGWDHLLPAWFSRLHPRFHTPVNSILFIGGITLAISATVLIGVGSQEAFEMLQVWGFSFYAIAYLALFAVPVIAIRNRSLRGPLWLRVLAVSGFLLTLLYVIFSVFPIIPVASERAYTQKTIAVLALVNIAGWLLYKLRPRRAMIPSAGEAGIATPPTCP